ncbi:MAG: plasmid pRiA4b ORF-3 family protein [Candidatus Sumerlaeia bacterium]|nr:plasmid pRiA4b ORF-3 family protein [Candidatus Sumerlaeia bacterium]
MGNGTETQIMQFKVTLKYISPPVWRRLLMPPDNTLGQLHNAIQGAMGWGNYHLHAFRFGTTQYGSSSIEEMNWMDEDAVTLHEMFSQPKTKARYTYDFGDGWEHEVVFEKFVPLKPGEDYPQCIAGKRACPPEDCGSYPGYERICQLIANPKLPDPEGLRKWVGRAYDPERFDLAAANKAVKRTR